MPKGYPNQKPASELTATPQYPWRWSQRTINAQALPAANAAGVLWFDSVPPDSYTNTPDTFILCGPIEPCDELRLRFVADHASAVASKSGTARLWLADEATVFNPVHAHNIEHCGRHVGDLTLATSAAPPLIPAESMLAAPSGQSAWIDTISISADAMPAPGIRLTSGGLEVLFDCEGSRFLMVALSIGTFAGLRVGRRCL